MYKLNFLKKKEIPAKDVGAFFAHHQLADEGGTIHKFVDEHQDLGRERVRRELHFLTVFATDLAAFSVLGRTSVKNAFLGAYYDTLEEQGGPLVDSLHERVRSYELAFKSGVDPGDCLSKVGLEFAKGIGCRSLLLATEGMTRIFFPQYDTVSGMLYRWKLTL